MERRQVEVSFSGGAFSSLGYSLLCMLLFVCIIPGAWGAAAFMLWWTGHMVFPDSTRAHFEGRPGRIWMIFAALAVLAYLPTIATFGMPHGTKTNAVSIVLTLALVPFEAALKLPIYRWIIEGIRLEPGGNPRFVATYPAYLGWVCLLILSFVTLIGWAWVAVAMVRWFCRNTIGDDYMVAFAGTGWGLLWRGFVWFVGSCLLIPIPWVLRSMYAWMTNNLLLIRSGQEAAQFATAA